jgi:hypothetical protein
LNPTFIDISGLISPKLGLILIHVRLSLEKRGDCHKPQQPFAALQRKQLTLGY